MTAALIVGGYFILMVIPGIIHRKKAGSGSVEFFLAGRTLAPLLMFFTMAATNFSAFTIFGLSGAGYRLGYAFFPVMGYATGFMALGFIIIGLKISKLSSSRGYITPADYIYDRYNSPRLKLLFSGLMIIFTLPYITIQTMAGGKVLHSLTGIPYPAGAFLVTLFVIIYAGMGGMRSIAWTDLIQGILMTGAVLASYYIIVSGAGGFFNIHRGLADISPAHLSRYGAGAGISPGFWFGYFVLWFFADPMFPQLFQRFIAEGSGKGLKLTVVLYPLVTTGLFFLTVSIGVIGSFAIPGLSASESDSILPLLLLRYSGEIGAAILLTGALSAVMSTLDSQLLTVSSMVSRDFPSPVKTDRFVYERRIVVFMALAGFAVSLYPPETMLDFINATAFNGLAVLSPAVIGGLYWKKGTKYGAASSIIAGEILAAASYSGIFKTYTGIMPILIIMPAVILIYAAVSLLKPCKNENTGIVFPLPPVRRLWLWGGIFTVMLVLGNDFWNRGKAPLLIKGFPLWVIYYIFLGIALSLLFAVFFNNASRRVPAAINRPGNE